MRFATRLLAGLLLALALLVPQQAEAVLDRAICSTADKGGTTPCSGPQLQSSTNEEISHAYDLGIITLTSVAGTNAITATAVPPITAYVDGAHYDLKPAGANTGAVTLSISGLPAKALTGVGGGALAGGELVTNARMLVVYDAGTDKFKLESQAATATVFGASGTGHSSGLVPDPGATAGSTRFLKEDGTWADSNISQVLGPTSISGTTTDIAGIPSWANEVTLVINNASKSAGEWAVQLGAGSIQTSGYYNFIGYWNNGGASGGPSAATWFQISNNASGSTTGFAGTLTLIRLAGSNTWLIESLNAISSGLQMHSSAGTVTLSGALDRLRLTTTASGTLSVGSISVFVRG